MVEALLKLRCCFTTSMHSEIGFSAYMNRIQIGPILIADRCQPIFIGSSNPKSIDCLHRVCAVDRKLRKKSW